MKTKSFAAILCIIAVMLPLCAFSCGAAQQSNDTAKEAVGFFDGILAYFGCSDDTDIDRFISGPLASSPASGNEWYVLALAQHGRYDLSAYERALVDHLEKNNVASVSSRLKFALVLAAIGSKSDYITRVLDDSIGKQGLMSYVFGLHLINNGCESQLYTADSVVDKLLSMQCSDGGWAVMGERADVDATAMTLQALAPHCERADVRAAVDTALGILSDRQLADGNFSSYGNANPESTAQVMIALSALGIDCKDDARFIKGGASLFDGLAKYRLSDGGFCHLAGGDLSSTATMQVFLAAVSYLRLKDGKSSLYLLDSVLENEDMPSGSDDQVISSDGGDGEVTSAGEDSEIRESSAASEPRTTGGKIKLWLSCAIAAIGVLSCILLVILKKRHRNNFIAVAALTLLALAIVGLADIKTDREYYDKSATSKENVIGTVTLTIRCDTVAGRGEHIPESGVILDVSEFEIAEGDTVYTILTEAARKYKLHIENDGGAYVYISGIEYIYEFDFGDLSGWMYIVNGNTPSVGAGEYKLSDGDVIEWHYTCDLGEDIK